MATGAKTTGAVRLFRRLDPLFKPDAPRAFAGFPGRDVKGKAYEESLLRRGD